MIPADLIESSVRFRMKKTKICVQQIEEEELYNILLLLCIYVYIHSHYIVRLNENAGDPHSFLYAAAPLF